MITSTSRNVSQTPKRGWWKIWLSHKTLALHMLGPEFDSQHHVISPRYEMGYSEHIHQTSKLIRFCSVFCNVIIRGFFEMQKFCFLSLILGLPSNIQESLPVTLGQLGRWYATKTCDSGDHYGHTANVWVPLWLYLVIVRPD